MFDPRVFEDHDKHYQMPDWFAHVLIVASYVMAFAAGYWVG